MDYCVRSISSSGHYSLAVQHTPVATYIILCFWSENVLHRVCIGGMLLPRKILPLVSSFLSLFETALSCVSLVGFGDKLNDCLFSCSPGPKSPSIVSSFGPSEFERTLAVPTAQIIERHDFRTILSFLLMKIRTALDKDWLQKLPLLHRVFIFFLYFEFWL